MRMQHIVEDPLALAAGKRRPCAGLRADSRQRYDRAPAARRRGIVPGRHRITSDVDAGVILRGSETELFSALANLVSNAVRYTPDGGQIGIRPPWTRAMRYFPSAIRARIAPRAHPAPDRALLPRRPQPFARYRRDRSRSGHRQARAIAPPCRPAYQQRSGPGSVFRVVFPLDRSGHEAQQVRGGDMPQRAVPEAGAPIRVDRPRQEA